MKKCLLITAFLFTCILSRAQVNLEAEFFSLPDTVTNEYLDTVSIKAQKPNDYWMVGVYGGASLHFGYFNPSRLIEPMFQYPVYGFSVVRHFTMFGIYPNMGFELGAQMNYEGYQYKANKETGYRAVESGAYKAMIKTPEAYILSHFHIDAGEYFKFIAKVGLYGGYRTQIHRVLDDDYADVPFYQEYVDKFRDYDKRWTYGLQGGVGFGIMVNPVEFHVNVQIKWGWNSFWQPDSASQFYYRFGYPLDGAITFGVYYQLTPRHGHSGAQLRKLARKMVEEQLQNHE